MPAGAAARRGELPAVGGRGEGDLGVEIAHHQLGAAPACGEREQAERQECCAARDHQPPHGWYTSRAPMSACWVSVVTTQVSEPAMLSVRACSTLSCHDPPQMCGPGSVHSQTLPCMS